MSRYAAEYEQVLSGIESPVDKAAFSFFYEATVKEGLDIMPGYTWDQFSEGVAPFNGVPVELLDDEIRKTNLVPNYDQASTEEQGLADVVPPLLTALDGPFIRALRREREKRAVRILAIHPSMATPYVIARAISASHASEYDGEDIRSSIYSVVGAYPTVMKYSLRRKDGTAAIVSPVDFGRSLGNILLTAPKTANTSTSDRAVLEWMREKRAAFKVRNREVLATAGAVEIVHPAGRRGRRSTATVPPFHHVEYLPDGNLGYITEIDVPTFIIGVADNLLNNPKNPGSIVRVVGDPEPWYLKTKDDVHEALRHSAKLSSHGRESYNVEGVVDQEMRHMKERAQQVFGRAKPVVE